MAYIIDEISNSLIEMIEKIVADNIYQRFLTVVNEMIVIRQEINNFTK
jgi:hypothetical protein